ncbi:CDP-diacylglycerol--glycerol-3-phosphate 3-phosphatidyltransferase [Rhodobacteraceae bacterium 2CG4]|uniref:CDP-diacylglycerol--glycerol-3-phosphate 3-phosphatidyltransferase n=1 Tax=Halovulum marinum TaxID=2662447 RepID=A0A6L5Z4T2_9RHOB|nr:CDP-diacylglycerol--glycerol-3-phosphate 3-phosphatidyltransferase [Halovulum marinum]MSU91319.1 CDP-diacylglycerol--glycerol-3-phosphate 3-phosphatidyltransferase [Halovulum marinum]
MLNTIPNVLTVLRLLAAPAFALVFVVLPSPVADWVALALFVGAALTDYFDGWLARRWGQVSAFGRMLDPIADKAMVVIALAVLMGLSGLNPWVLIPAAMILFREVFVSGLREYLGADAGKLAVTRLAKWKTTVQMVAIPLLMLAEIFEYDYLAIYNQIGPEGEAAVLAGAADDEFGLRRALWISQAASAAGVATIWIAGVLTLITGIDYFRKALPFLTPKEG